MDPPAALIAIGRFLVESWELQRLINNVFEKVSPNLDTGPWIKAGPIPSLVYS